MPYLNREAYGTSPLPAHASTCTLAGKYIMPSYMDCSLTSVDSMFARFYDFHQAFHKELPQFSFYPVPELLIFAIDSHGGAFVSTNPQAKHPDCTQADIYYLDAQKRLYFLAENMQDFFSLLIFCPDFKQQLGLADIPTPQPDPKGRALLIERYDLHPQALPQTEKNPAIRFFSSFEEAKQHLDFV